MDWVWRRLASYVGHTKTQIEFSGISEDVLAAALRQEALNRLTYVETIVFSEEIEDAEKITTLKEWFLTNDK